MQSTRRNSDIGSRVFRAALVLGLAFSLVCPIFSKTITIIHSNDIHGIYKPFKIKVEEGERLIGGMEAASHYLDKIRAEENNILLIDLGDVLTGTLAADIEYKGVPGGAMIEFLNRLDYDVWCYGNHEFDKGQPNVLKLVEVARFPSVMSNIVYEKSGKPFTPNPYHIIDLAGLKVGVIAVMEENFLQEVYKDKVEGLKVLPIVPVLNSYVAQLDKQTDLIVVLNHGPFDQGVRIARDVKGIDIVLVSAEDGRFKDVDGVLVKSTFGHQRTLGYLKVDVEEDRIIDYEEKLIWLWADIDLKPSPRITALVKEVEASIKTEYARVVGEAKFDHTHKGYPQKNEAGESPLGNWVTDVMRWKTGTQIALHNSGGIRAEISKGPITRADVFDVSPFRNTLVIFKLTGQQIKDILELDVERAEDRFQVSGFKYRYYPKNTRPPGERVDYVEVNGEVLVNEGKVLHPKKVYSAVSNNYLVGQAEDKYFGFPVTCQENTGLILEQVMVEWLLEYKVLEYKVEERIVELK
jgi:2',3'-cyclic-nucleotide 2'-phosphodiesterase (5'-nucleotidase family)